MAISFEHTSVLSETNATREKAEVLLQGLIEAKTRTESELSKLRRTDAYKAVTGRSALDNAIASTRRMIESLDRTAEDIGGRVGELAR